LFEHDLFGKPVSTFPDHAQEPPSCTATKGNPYISGVVENAHCNA
jgi:hypothetical protein